MLLFSISWHKLCLINFNSSFTHILHFPRLYVHHSLSSRCHFQYQQMVWKGHRPEQGPINSIHVFIKSITSLYRTHQLLLPAWGSLRIFTVLSCLHKTGVSTTAPGKTHKYSRGSWVIASGVEEDCVQIWVKYASAMSMRTDTHTHTESSQHWSDIEKTQKHLLDSNTDLASIYVYNDISA